ncbi:MAG: hypothetical protein CVT80_16150 [Alphaproteobacteria bacterium HGW-Alphaproteobacteria-2]|nr:MAG: hypothetical protein CVT80_16150 [Alphaproteobacteria bacterium HGW-Alphaproteobacteria-2]
MARYRSVSPLSLLAAALLLAASPAAAASLTFDGVPEGGGANCFGGGPESVAEGGFTISNCPGYWIAPGNIHLNDGGSAFSGSVEFSAPVPFRAESVTILGFGSAFTDQETREPVAYENVLFEGFRDGALVARQGHSTGLLAKSVETVLFGPEFAALDLLRISQVLPGAEDLARYPDAYCADRPCAQISLLDIRLSPVPLPAGLPLLAAALAAFGLLARRRRTG